MPTVLPSDWVTWVKVTSKNWVALGHMSALSWAGGAKKDVAASEPQMDLSHLFPLDETTISRPGLALTS